MKKWKEKSGRDVCREKSQLTVRNSENSRTCEDSHMAANWLSYVYTYTHTHTHSTYTYTYTCTHIYTFAHYTRAPRRCTNRCINRCTGRGGTHGVAGWIKWMCETNENTLIPHEDFDRERCWPGKAQAACRRTVVGGGQKGKKKKRAESDAVEIPTCGEASHSARRFFRRMFSGR